MARRTLRMVIVLLSCSGIAHAETISPTAQYIKDRPYEEISTADPIGSILSGDIEKASGIVPSVGNGLVAWADGRGGMVAIVGRDLTDPPGSEFLISDETDGWQEGNPFAGVIGAPTSGDRRVVYDAANVAVTSGDLGDIQGYTHLSSTTAWLYQTPVALDLQRSPVFVNVPGDEPPYKTYLSWIDCPGTQSQFPGYTNTDIYTATYGSPATNVTNITSGTLAPRDALAGDGKYLVWQELTMHDPFTEESSWDVVVHNLNTTSSAHLDVPDAGKNQIAPDVDGRLVVWTQEEDPSGTGVTNVYFQDLSSSVGALPITTYTSVGSATNAAISKATANEDGSYFVVWQDRSDDSTSFYLGGNGETDYNWDIWAQEIKIGLTGEYELHNDPFLIRSDPGRQTNPDIDGLDVVWQSQAPNVEDIYVWGAVPEPCTMLVIVAGVPLLLVRRRRRRKLG